MIRRAATAKENYLGVIFGNEQVVAFIVLGIVAIVTLLTQSDKKIIKSF